MPTARRRRWRPPPGTPPAGELLTTLAAVLFVAQERARRQGELAARRADRALKRARQRWR